MIFDSQAQKQRVIDLIGEVPINTNIAGIASGLSPELAALLRALHQGVVAPLSSQDELLVRIDESSGDQPDEKSGDRPDEDDN